MAKTGTKNMTLKQKRFAKEYVKTKGNKTQAVINAGYDVKNRDVAAQIGVENMNKPKIQQEIKRQLDNAGLTDTKIFEGLEKIINEGSGNEPTASDALRGIDMVLKLKDYYPSKKTTVEKKHLSFHYHQKEDDEVMETIKDQIKQLKDVV